MKQGDWTCTDETASELELQELLYALVRALKPNLVVETGTYLGDATLQLAMACEANGKGRVVTCDTQEKYLAEARKKLARFPVELVLGSSLDLPELKEADFIFSDSDYKFRAAEIGRAKKGAVILVHDTKLSFDPNVPPLEQLVWDCGGICFQTYRGFGLLVRK